jgi:hypothetical protein
MNPKSEDDEVEDDNASDNDDVVDQPVEDPSTLRQRGKKSAKPSTVSSAVSAGNEGKTIKPEPSAISKVITRTVS